MNECEELIRPVLREMAGAYEIRPGDAACTIVTPFQHSNGDLVTLYVKPHQGDYVVVRDYGETFAMLRMYGVDPTSDSRERRFERICDQFDLEGSSEEIKLRAEKEELHKRFLDAIQAIQAVSYLIYTHKSQQPSRFRTEVVDFLEDAGYVYDTEFTVPGETHTRTFDISINHREPNVLLDTIHTTKEYNLRQQVDGVMLNWHEIKESEFSHGAVVDDVDGIYEEKILDRLIENLDYFFRWSEKERITQDIPITA